MTIVHEGVELNIILRDGFIDLQWSGSHITEDVAFIPISYQQSRLVSRENMHPVRDRFTAPILAENAEGK